MGNGIVRLRKVSKPNETYFSTNSGEVVTVIRDRKILPLKWREVDGDEIITLSDISNQYPKSSLLVIAEGPLEGTIYRFGNYDYKYWYEVGCTRGYA